MSLMEWWSNDTSPIPVISGKTMTCMVPSVLEVMRELQRT